MNIKILGTGGALSELSTSYLINESILIDCGLDIVKKIIKNGDIDKINKICITHLHMDHVSGFELFLFYKLFKHETFKVFAGIDFLDFYKNLKCSIDPKTGSFIQPFTFIEYFNKPSIHARHIINSEINLNITKAIHMGGTIPAYSLTFIEGEDPFNSSKIIISGDTDIPINTTASLLEKQNIICFHDMGWTGLEDLKDIHKAHCTEYEILENIGQSDRIYGIHINDNVELKYYKKAEVDKIYSI